MTKCEKSAKDKNKCRFFLRSETADIHEQLHQVAHFKALFGGTLSLEEYVTLIRRLHGFYVHLDQKISTACDQCPLAGGRFKYVSRANLLARDLEALGMTRSDIRSGATCPHSEPIETAECLGGVLYVIEGSVLGGSVIANALKGMSAPEHVVRDNYWTWCRSNGKDRWTMTLQMIEELDEQGADRVQMVDAAKSTFAAMHDWLTPLEMVRGGSQRQLQ